MTTSDRTPPQSGTTARTDQPGALRPLAQPEPPLTSPDAEEPAFPSELRAPRTESRPEPRTVTVSGHSVGSIELATPSFLERWGVIFLAVFSLWIVLVGSVLLVYFLRRQPPAPSLSGLTMDQIQTTLTAQKALDDRWRDALNYIFDLLITKTALPLVTLLLGYLFGKARSLE